MSYLLYSLLFALLGVATSTSPNPSHPNNPLPLNHQLTLHPVLILTRNHWLPVLHQLPHPSLPFSNSTLYSRLPSFSSDIESGLSSSTFDLSANVDANDSRAGLDDASKKEIQKIMRNRRVGFDEARRIYTEGRFAKNGIGPDGRPRDPKFVSFS